MTQCSEKGAYHMALWSELQETLNRGDFAAMDRFFHADFEYSNPSRPDLKGYEAWRQSPVTSYATFEPSHYCVKRMTADGDDVWALCAQSGTHSHGQYMGYEPSGKTFYTEWFSIISFRDGRIAKIFSIADVLGKFVQLGILDASLKPVDAYNRK
jgi:ketosteroid isomerase-like protein